MDNIKNLFTFLDESYSVYHAISNIKEILLKNNFKEIKENELELIDTGNYFITKNMSSIIAFKVGNNLKSDYGFNIVASHSDSPTFKLKPNPIIKKGNYSCLNVEPYGGGIYHTFMNKPLSIAGRCCIMENDLITTKLVNFPFNIALIPTLPIHFNREANNNLSLNPQIDMLPFISEEEIDFSNILAKNLNVEKNQILSSDLYLYNTEKSCYIGLNNEYFGSKKIDNLESAFCSLMAFIESKNESNINVYACFDNEEVGSKTKQGADSIFLNTVLNKIASQVNKSSIDKVFSNSYFVSIDNAHAINPNHMEKYDQVNKVFMNKGLVIKNNANQSYTTDATSKAILIKILNKNNLPYQEFSNRSDIRGGSTLGCLSNSFVNVLSVDIGLSQLAMHSSFEVAGVKDVLLMISSVKAVYETNIRYISDGSYIVK